MNQEAKREQIRTGQRAPGLLHMGGAPNTRENSLRIDKVYPLKTDRYDEFDNIWFPLPPPDTDLQEHLHGLAIQAGYKDLKRSFADISIPDRRMWVLRHPPKDADAVKPSPVWQLRNALLLAKASTLLYDPAIPPVFTRRRLERNIKIILIRLETYYELD